MFKPFCCHRDSSVDILVACLRISISFEGASFRETHLWEHSCRTDRIALITCLKKSVSVKIILTTPTPHITKKYDPKICHKMRGRMAYTSLEIKGLSQRMWCTNRLLWHTNSDFYGIRTPTFTPYEPFLLGVGVVFNIKRIRRFLFSSLQQQNQAETCNIRLFFRARSMPRSRAELEMHKREDRATRERRNQ